MQKTKTQLKELRLAGIACRTNNKSEMDPSTAKISSTVQHYFQNALPEKIGQRKKPGTTYCVYTNYESDVTGDYTYFVGEEVASFDDLADGLTSLTIPAQHYTKWTNGPGAMPNVCISAWQKIWSMSLEELGGEREYLADFEVYDERATDPQNVTLDVYIGVKS